jgi:hypothetical protein
MRRFTKLVVPLAAALVIVGTLTLAGSAATGTSVGLGTAGSFVVLAGAGVTNTGPTTLNGDIGTYPTTSESGVGSLTITGTNHAGDAVTQQAKSDLVTGYDTTAGEGPTSPISADLGGQTLTPGVYNSASSLGLTGNLTLDGGGDPNAVFVFQAGSTLTTASASSVTLENGAQACNVFWQVGSSATLGTASSFVGTLIALTSITLTTRATVEGRMLARNGAVTLDTNTITAPSCTTAATTTAATTTAATTTAATTTAATTTSASTPTATTPTATTPAATTVLNLAAARFAAAKKAAAKKAAAKHVAKKAVAKPVVKVPAVKVPAVKVPVVKVPVVKVPVVKVPVVKVPVVRVPVVKVPPVKKAPRRLRPKPPVHHFGITG